MRQWWTDWSPTSTGHRTLMVRKTERHRDYMVIYRDFMVFSWIYCFNEFDCKVIFPSINDFEMDSEVILLQRIIQI